MTYAPANVRAFMSVWTSNGGVNSGIVGDSAHAARPSYHNGWDRAVARYGTTSMTTIASKDYTFRLPRDQVKSDAAMAADLGKLDGTLKSLYMFSAWLVAMCRSGKPGYENIREIIYSPDGVYVKRYSHSNNTVYTSLRKNADGSITTINAGQGDSSHYWHTHISFYRDSEKADLASLIRPFFEEADVPTLTSYIPGQKATIKPTANIRTAPKLTASIIRVVDATPDEWTVTGWVKGDVDPEGGSDLWLTRWYGGKWEYTAKSNVSAGPAAPPTGGFTQAQVDAAVKTATDALNLQLAAANAAAQVAAATEKERIANKVADGIRAL